MEHNLHKVHFACFKMKVTAVNPQNFISVSLNHQKALKSIQPDLKPTQKFWKIQNVVLKRILYYSHMAYTFLSAKTRGAAKLSTSQ